MEWIGYFAAILIGVCMGLIGAGGSILTVPVLVYLLHVAPWMATTYSLFVVGATSVVGAARSYSLIQWRTVFLFGLSSIVTVLFTRKFLLPVIPGNIPLTGDFVLTKDRLLMTLFALLMTAASSSMIKTPDPNIEQEKAERNKSQVALRLLVQGALVGMVTGILGAGGGFLIIPVLVMIRKLPMKTAVATSLTIIAINSLIGFFGGADMTLINWNFLLRVSGIAVSGIFIGIALSKKIPGAALKKSFGWFILVMGLVILSIEWLLPSL